MTTACPCGSESEYDACCRPVLDGAPATTAVALMRSRYTAYAVGRFDHLENSLSAIARDHFNRSAAENMAEGIKWLGLEVRNVTGGTVEDQEGTVEFIARYQERGQEMAHHELASFVREDGRWVFSEGKTAPKGQPRRVTPVGRNDPCPCGSGKKFKKCHGA